nr:hypothetical protein [Tanacetum cinerariifolium]
MGRDTVQPETTVNTISREYLLEFTSEYGIPEALHPELPGPEDRIVDFPEGKIHLSQLSVIGAAKQEAGEEYPPVIYQALGLSQKLEQPLFLGGRESVPDRRGLANEAPKEWMPAENMYSAEAVRTLDTHRTPIQKQPEMPFCLVGISRRYYLGDEVYPTFLHDEDRSGLIRAPNPTKVKTRSRPRAAHEVPLLTMTANRVIEMEDPATATDSSGVPSTIDKSPLDFANEAGAADYGTMALEVPPPEDVPTTSALEAGQAKEVAATDPSAVTESCKRGHDGVDANAPPKVLRKDHADPRPTGSTRERKSLAAIELGMASTRPVPVPEVLPWTSSQGTAAVGDSESGNASFASVVWSPESIYRPEWGVAHVTMLDTTEACQDLVDHVAIGSQLRLRFEQEAKLLKKSVAQVARRDKRIQAREHEIKNLEALLEAEADMKKAAEEKNAKLSQELENMRALFSDLQMDARLDALSIDFDEELYPHMITVIAGRRWMIGRGLSLAVMKCGESLELRQAFVDVVSVRIAKGMSEGLRHRVEHGQAQLSLESIEVYDLEAEAKYIAALQALKDLKYLLVDLLEGLKDAPMDVIMAALYLKSETGDDVPQQAYKEEMLLSDAIATNVSRAKKKKKCRIVCRTHRVGFAHHAQFDGVPVSVPTVVPQGLAILLADATTQTEPDEATLDNL